MLTYWNRRSVGWCSRVFRYGCCQGEPPLPGEQFLIYVHWLTTLQTAFLGEILVSWLLVLISLPLCALVLWHTRDTNYDIEKITRVEDVQDGVGAEVAMPEGHHLGEHKEPTAEVTNEKA